MALDTRRPTEPAQAPANTVQHMYVPARKRTRHAVRTALMVLEAIMAVSAIAGAIWVVPTIPRAWLHQGLIAPFSDYTIPALALGILCGGAALLALITVLLRPRLGGLMSIAAGVFMVGFELVEILVVGFTPVQNPTLPPAWLQPIYILLGATIALLGIRLWRAEANSH